VHVPVQNTGISECEDFEVGIVGGNDCVNAFPVQLAQNSFSNGAARLRIGTTAHLVNQHQGFWICFLDENPGILQSRRIGRKVIVQTLLIANVGKDLCENSKLAQFMDRHQQATLHHHLQ